MSFRPTTILAIETSCDETGVAILSADQTQIKVLHQSVSSQVDIHKLTGGVVPEIAAREHVTVIQPILREALSASHFDPFAIDAIAVTIGPGLMPALSIGVTAAQTIAYAWDKPIIPIHHLEGHLYSALLAPPASHSQASVSSFPFSHKATTFPALALIVSGGHTMLVKMSGHLQYKILGSTRDDAAGEAFDKIARLLGLDYPGGPAISVVAAKGNSAAYPFTRPMQKSGDLDFSFSGLKTEVLYKWRDLNQSNPNILADVAASFQQAVVDSLVYKTKQALAQEKPASLLLAGGVAANSLLRRQMSALSRETNTPLHIASPSQCGDNATMIGLAAIFAYRAGRLRQWSNIDAKARVSIEAYS